MSTPSLVEDIFLAAVEKATPEERAAYLDKACRGDAELRRRVERLLAARKEYQNSLEGLRKHYVAVGDAKRAHWAEDELRQYHRMTKQSFRLDLEVPPPTLQAAYNIPEANELYRRAMSYKDKGWSDDYLFNQRRAEILLQQLLTNFPQSDKIGDAAFQLGVEPGAGVGPVPFGGGQRDAESLGRLGHGQSGEEPQLDQLRPERRLPGQLGECLVQCQ